MSRGYKAIRISDKEAGKMVEFRSVKLYAPLSGPILSLTQVPDPVFSQKMVGDGIAIDPTTTVLLAPCSGTISQLHSSKHAVAIQPNGEPGVEVLMHVGLDTVTLKGEGFTANVKLGDQVQKGQPLIAFDADLLARKALSLITLIIVTEAPAHQLVFPKSGLAEAGTDLLIDLQLSQDSTGPAKSSNSVTRAESNPVRVLLATGLHARPAALLVSQTKKYDSKIVIKKGAQTANAKSVVALLGLEIGSGDSVQFIADGADAKQAVSELASFLSTLDEKPAAHQPAHAPVQSVPTHSANPKLMVGVAASPGIVVGHVHQIRAESFDIAEKAESPNAERTSLAKAVRAAGLELETLQNSLASKTEGSQAAIFAAHAELLEDPDLIELTNSGIDKGQTASYAWNFAIQTHAGRLANLNNELMAGRANDLRDVGHRVLRLLLGKPENKVDFGNGNAILIAENLTPSDTAQLDRGHVLGFCTTTGGSTSHVAILARSLGLPAIAGIENRALQIPEGTEVVLDGDRGEIRLQPTAEEKALIQKQNVAQAEKRKSALAASTEHAVTKDGQTVEVAANIGGVEDARRAVEMGCDGVGLLRSEFLFLERATAPTEEEQYRVYQEIADVLGARPLVIRTLDVGGDKPLQYLPLPPEENPFLGVRGIRIGFLQPEILREQLRAILRVKTQGTLNIMFPMIAMIEEFRAAKAMLEEERLKLRAPPVKVGIMIEVPSAAVMAETFAREADFFSIGTNDLTQYTLAMDRGHKDLAKQVDGLHPSVLKLIELTVQAAHRHGKWVGVCGGLASDSKAVPILLGLGVDELSVSIPVLPLIKSQVRELTIKASQDLAQRATQAATAKDVRELSLD